MKKLILITDDEKGMALAVKREVDSQLGQMKASGDIHTVRVEDSFDATIKAYLWLLDVLNKTAGNKRKEKVEEKVCLLLITDCEIGYQDDGPDFIGKIRDLQGSLTHFKFFKALLMSSDAEYGFRQADALHVPFLDKPLTEENRQAINVALQELVKS